MYIPWNEEEPPSYEKEKEAFYYRTLSKMRNLVSNIESSSLKEKDKDILLAKCMMILKNES